MNISNNSYSPNFKSLKPQKRLGEEVLKQLGDELGPLKSSSMLKIRINRLSNKGEFKRKNPLLEPMLRYKQLVWDEQIYDDFMGKETGIRSFGNLDSYCKELKKNIKQKNNKANCWEDMMLVFNELSKRGEKPYPLRIDVTTKNKWNHNHFTTIFGLKNDAKLEDPKTWGSKAIVVDYWLGIVDSARNGIAKINEFIASGSKIKNVKYGKVPLEYISFKTPITHS